MFTALVLSLLPLTPVLEALPAQVILIRHAEKATKIDTGNSDMLSTKGKERAVALVPYFAETKEFTTNGAIVAIYATNPSKEYPSTRCIDTVTPLADKLKLTVSRNFVIDDYKKMVDEIKSNAEYKNKVVLICWEHNFIPEIARAFGALQSPSRWPTDTYDRSWSIIFSPTGKATLQNIPQKLLFGDSAT